MTNPRLILPSDFSSRSSLIVGISGGCDSVALLRLLAEQGTLSYKRIVAAHVNYGLRGKDSNADEAFVRQLCAQWHIPLRVLRVPGFKKKIKNPKFSLQDEARKIRYSFFLRLVQKEKAWGAAVAHHLEDQAETVMDRFLRGAGAKGLSGLRSTQTLRLSPGAALQVWRPLLGCTKNDLKTYLESRSISWREDRSNQKLDYRRNQIRHQVLPFLQKWNSRLVESLSRMGEVASAEDEFLDQWVSTAGQKLKGKWTSKSYFCSRRAFQKHHRVFQRRWVKQVAEKLNPDARGLSFDRVEMILHLWDGQEKGPRDVGYGLSAGLSADQIFLKNLGLPKH